MLLLQEESEIASYPFHYPGSDQMFKTLCDRTKNVGRTDLSIIDTFKI